MVAMLAILDFGLDQIEAKLRPLEDGQDNYHESSSMFFLISRSPLKLGYLGSKTRSQG